VGETVNPRDAETQAVETLLNIAALLADRGGSLADICSSTVYCKSRIAYEAYKRVLHLLGIPQFPSICVLAEICRPDLEIEIEAVAIV
jgi:enamine deaminase RidA (YjgF/YER057c/UK114 family)